MDSSVKCGNCRFFHDIGYCRKKSPAEGPSYRINEDHWCGEFKRKFIHEEDNRNLKPQNLVVQECGNCIHFRTAGGVEILKITDGFCAYNPPSMLNSNISMFPKVNKKASCSKFRAREIIIEEPQNVLTPGKRAITFGDS